MFVPKLNQAWRAISRLKDSDGLNFFSPESDFRAFCIRRIYEKEYYHFCIAVYLSMYVCRPADHCKSIRTSIRRNPKAAFRKPPVGCHSIQNIFQSDTRRGNCCFLQSFKISQRLFQAAWNTMSQVPTLIRRAIPLITKCRRWEG